MAADDYTNPKNSRSDIRNESNAIRWASLANDAWHHIVEFANEKDLAQLYAVDQQCRGLVIERLPFLAPAQLFLCCKENEKLALFILQNNALNIKLGRYDSTQQNFWAFDSRFDRNITNGHYLYEIAKTHEAAKDYILTHLASRLSRDQVTGLLATQPQYVQPIPGIVGY